MFADYMTNTWITASAAAVIAGVVGYFVVLRGSSFAAHAIPHGAFAGAAAASLAGAPTLLGLGLFGALTALGIARLGRGGRHDVATALTLIMLLGLGALCLSMNTEYEPEIFSLLFGEILAVSTTQLWPTLLLTMICLAATAQLYRPLTLTSISPPLAQARGLHPHRVDTYFLLLVVLATSMTVPVVGTLLLFSLMIGPAAAARCLTHHPLRALTLSVVISVGIAWASIACAYQLDWPVGFFIGALSALTYLTIRLIRHRL